MNILIVEDSPTQAEALRGVLENFGYTATVVGTVQDARHVLKVHEPKVDACIYDIVMPGRENGYDLLAWTVLNRPDLPCVMTTTHSSVDNCRKAFRLGAAGYIDKSELFTGTISEVELAIKHHNCRERAANQALESLKEIADDDEGQE